MLIYFFALKYSLHFASRLEFSTLSHTSPSAHHIIIIIITHQTDRSWPKARLTSLLSRLTEKLFAFPLTDDQLPNSSSIKRMGKSLFSLGFSFSFNCANPTTTRTRTGSTCFGISFQLSLFNPHNNHPESSSKEKKRRILTQTLKETVASPDPYSFCQGFPFVCKLFKEFSRRVYFTSFARTASSGNSISAKANKFAFP